MQAENIYTYLDKKYQFKNQLAWDQSWFIKNGSQVIDKVLLCLDITQREIDYAIANQVFLIISHHPIFIDPSFPLQESNKQQLKLLKKHKISLIFLHTAFDRSPLGMNAAIANQLALQNIQCSQNQNYAYGTLKTPLSMSQVASVIKKSFKLDYVKYEQSQADCVINTVAVCGGSGSDLIYEPFDAPVDVLITSDIKHHPWMDASALGIKLMDINHTVENIFIDVVANDLKLFNKQIKSITKYNKLKFTII